MRFYLENFVRLQWFAAQDDAVVEARRSTRRSASVFQFHVPAVVFVKTVKPFQTSKKI